MPKRKEIHSRKLVHGRHHFYLMRITALRRQWKSCLHLFFWLSISFLPTNLWEIDSQKDEVKDVPPEAHQIIFPFPLVVFLFLLKRKEETKERER